ncbi:hypothetical protein FACS189472_13190 [Alphaproteobacteria bacterium]|nr:hypothetical protein FACS189472_13190 [Alphaproteobacteria bacterium]
MDVEVVDAMAEEEEEEGVIVVVLDEVFARVPLKMRSILSLILLSNIKDTPNR